MVPDGLFPCLRLPYQSMNAIILLQFFCEKNSSTFKRRTADVVHDHLQVLITRILEIQELFRIYTVKMLHIFLCCLTFLLPSIFEGEATRGAISIEQHRHLRLFLVGFLFNHRGCRIFRQEEIQKLAAKPLFLIARGDNSFPISCVQV